MQSGGTQAEPRLPVNFSAAGGSLTAMHVQHGPGLDNACHILWFQGQSGGCWASPHLFSKSVSALVLTA